MMSLNAKLVRILVGGAVAAGFCLAAPRSEAAADAPGASVQAVYLWKDTKGRCPATCDRNIYDCPCMLAPL